MKTLPFRYEVMDGKGEPMFIDFRRATVDDLDKVIALQNEIVDALPDKDLYATFTREESLGQLEHDICMMAECDGEVAGYSAYIQQAAPRYGRRDGSFRSSDDDIT